MSPKAKADNVTTHRIEFQQTERDALEMVAASITARNATQSVANLTKGVGNLIDPVLSASAAGVAAALGIIAWWELRDLENENNPTFDKAFGDSLLGKIIAPLQGPEMLRVEATPEQKAQAQEERRNWRMKLNQFRNAISTQLMQFKPFD
jgi:hypothetical protein|tara:strand:- start:1442 stop:1891 length:450 start_codon:yes stop_codon:yes gene_type:complete